MADESSPMNPMEARKGMRIPRFRLSLSTSILIGMTFGILTGIFFGELVGSLDTIGNAFIRLLQMTILPYILASLILGIGGLTYEKARLLAVKAGGAATGDLGHCPRLHPGDAARLSRLGVGDLSVIRNVLGWVD